MIMPTTGSTVAYRADLRRHESQSPLPEPSPVDRFFHQELQAARADMASSPLWDHFRTLPDSLLTYLYSEKHRLAMTGETRCVVEHDHPPFLLSRTRPPNIMRLRQNHRYTRSTGSV